MSKKAGIILSLCLVIFSLSCSKKDDAPSYYVKFRLNGEMVNFPNAIGDKATDPVFTDKTILQITGVSADQKKSFGIILRGDHADMQRSLFASNSMNIEMYIMYGVEYNAAGDIYAYQIEDASGREPSYYSVQITSITDTEIQGNFTGNYLHNSLLTGSGVDDVVEITEGEFKIKRN